MMNVDIDLYEALVDAGVSKDKARDVVLAQKDSMDQLLTTLATKADLAESRTYVDGRFNLVKTDLAECRAYVDGRFNLVKTDLAEFRAYVDGRFNLVGEQMTSMANRIVIRLGALMVVLTGLLGALLGFMRR
ncbi:MAG TPA: hypothetical protein VGN30_12245 [Steroidobacteraceae bacterium]